MYNTIKYRLSSVKINIFILLFFNYLHKKPSLIAFNFQNNRLSLRKYRTWNLFFFNNEIGPIRVHTSRSFQVKHKKQTNNKNITSKIVF